jgi:hypothetical protein
MTFRTDPAEAWLFGAGVLAGLSGFCCAGGAESITCGHAARRQIAPTTLFSSAEVLLSDTKAVGEDRPHNRGYFPK